MAISPISSSGITPIKLNLLDRAQPSGTGTGGAFGNAVSGAIEHLNGLQKTTDALAQQASTGTLTNIEDYLTSATETQLTTQLTVAVRNKAVEAFQEIMRMQV